MIYFTSDLHFDHENIIHLTKRPFRDAAQMNATLIKQWNATIKPSDEVYILGDVTMKNAEVANTYLKQLRGRKYLITGNHDRFIKNQDFDESLFVWIKDYYELKYQGTLFVLFHYPIMDWNGMYRNSIHLHGHIHSHAYDNFLLQEQGIRRYDVGVDANEFRPISIEEIIKKYE